MLAQFSLLPAALNRYAVRVCLRALAFTAQIYGDFSGYTDIAIGLALIMGFHIPRNFNLPYFSRSPVDFWRRWHISLSSWLRDYLYISLGGNRNGHRTRNVFLTMLLGGLWHGAAWTFVIWGALHGLGVLVMRELERSAVYRDRVPTLLKQLAVFAFVSFTWIFFRAESLSDAFLIVRRIFTGAWQNPQIPALMVLLVASVWIYEYLSESRFKNCLQLSPVRVATAATMVVYICLASSGGGAFIYFQF